MTNMKIVRMKNDFLNSLYPEMYPPSNVIGRLKNHLKGHRCQHVIWEYKSNTSWPCKALVNTEDLEFIEFKEC